MKIGEVAKRVGVSISTLRMYEQRRLLRTSRSAGGTRHYSEGDVARFSAIVALVQADVPIDSLAALAHVRPTHASGDAASYTVESHLSAIEAALDERLRLLQSVRTDLRRARQRLAGCHGCRKRPIRKNCDSCTVAGELLETRVMRIVWDQEPSDD